jgi:hypothetical protein
MCVPVSNTVDTRHIWLDWIISFLQIIIGVHGVRQWQSQKFYKYWAKSQFCPKLTPKISKKFGRACASAWALSPPQWCHIWCPCRCSCFIVHHWFWIFDVEVFGQNCINILTSGCKLALLFSNFTDFRCILYA